jgi:hypothetical protein
MDNSKLIDYAVLVSVSENASKLVDYAVLVSVSENTSKLVDYAVLSVPDAAAPQARTMVMA